MNYQNTACIRNILYNYNQRIERIEQNISQMLTNTTSSNKLKNVNGLLIPKFRFVKYSENEYMLNFVFQAPEYSDFSNLPTSITKDNFYGKEIGSYCSNASTGITYMLMYNATTDDSDYSRGAGFYAIMIYRKPNLDTEEQPDINIVKRFMGKTLYECGLSKDPEATFEFNDQGVSQLFDLTYKGKQVYVTNEVINEDIFVYIPQPLGVKMSKIGFKLSTQICGCDYALALTTPAAME